MLIICEINVLANEINSYKIQKNSITTNCHKTSNCTGDDCQTIVEISRITFRDCFTFENKVNITKMELEILPEEVFYDLPNVTEIIINHSSLTYLQPHLFDKNTQLTIVDFNFNRLTIIESNFPTSLKTLALRSNVCVDKMYTVSNYSIERVKLDINNCTFSATIFKMQNLTNSIEQEKQLNQTLDKYKESLSNSSKTIKGLEKEKNELNEAKIENEKQFNQTLVKYKNSESNYSKTIKGLQSEKEELNKDLQNQIHTIKELKLAIDRLNKTHEDHKNEDSLSHNHVSNIVLSCMLTVFIIAGVIILYGFWEKNHHVPRHAFSSLSTEHLTML